MNFYGKGGRRGKIEKERKTEQIRFWQREEERDDGEGWILRNIGRDIGNNKSFGRLTFAVCFRARLTCCCADCLYRRETADINIDIGLVERTTRAENITQKPVERASSGARTRPAVSVSTLLPNRGTSSPYRGGYIVMELFTKVQNSNRVVRFTYRGVYYLYQGFNREFLIRYEFYSSQIFPSDRGEKCNTGEIDQIRLNNQRIPQARMCSMTLSNWARLRKAVRS